LIFHGEYQSHFNNPAARRAAFFVMSLSETAFFGEKAKKHLKKFCKVDFFLGLPLDDSGKDSELNY
jgi:hypothetical protein